MQQNISSSTGNAPIVKIGHTQGPAYGTNPQMKAKGQAAAPATDVNFGK